MHWCANAVCGEVDEGVAVLLRALEPVSGVEEMRAARPKARTDRDLCRGPARLCQALGITGEHNGIDLVAGEAGITIVDDGTPPPDDPVVTPRIGITQGAEHPWRWYVAGSRYVSR
jgi:DNA-3-methyladenine glycosylase